MALRGEVLSLYRRVLRLARTWKSASGSEAETAEERRYIQDESRRLFKKNKNLTSEAEIKDHLKEAETRIEMAVHYRNPYPRLVNIPQNVLPPLSTRLKKGQKRAIESSKPIYLKSYVKEDS